MYYSHHIILTALLAFTTLPVLAQEQEDVANDSSLLMTNLKLREVEVTAQRRPSSGTTSYVMGRMTLDHAQVMNLSDIMSLLPGGKTINSTLMDDSRLSLRSGSGEKGNAAFGTAIEVDGMRLDNNAMMDEVLSASTRNLSSSNIGSLEVISGIAGVEYGDISNGIVKVNTRRGASPWIFEASVNPYTRQVALNKGFNSLNLSLEHARSFSNTASPHTSYQRNTLAVAYERKITLTDREGLISTLTLRGGLTGNIGGYNSEADPDAFKDTYSKARDNQLRGNLEANWIYNILNKDMFKVSLTSAFSTSDKRAEYYSNANSSSAQAYLHTMADGYAIAQEYDGAAGWGGITLGPTGYWYVRRYNDQKPVTSQMKMKGEWTHLFNSDGEVRADAVNKVMVGVERNTSRNNGKGVYYEDMRYAPTWRPYIYKELPTLKNIALFAEDRFTIGKIQMTAGVRDDITMIPGSEYGTLSSFSPRISARYRSISGMPQSDKLEGTIHAGWGKSVKLPSFQVLYPADAYTDKLVFSPGSTSDNKSFYAYHTKVERALYNPDLKWQYANQVDLGFDAFYKGMKLSVSGFWTRTHNAYQMVNIYTPFQYNTTSQSAVESCGIAMADRRYAIDAQSGIVSVSSVSAPGTIVTLPYTTHNTYTTNRRYVNGSPVTRYGVEWIMDMPLVSTRSLVGLALRIDGSYYHYKGVDQSLIAGSPNGIGDMVSGNDATGAPLIGYYNGCNTSSASAASTPSVSNGILSRGCNLNATLTARIPKVGLIMTLKIESTLLNYKRQLADGNNAVLLKAAGDVFGERYDGEENHYVAVYPAYYSTWQNPTERIPYAETLERASTEDPALYQQLTKLIVRSNTSYLFNPARISSYYSCNFSVSKDIGTHLSLSFYANNFLNSMKMVSSSQTGLESSLFNSGLIPKFYYGMSVRIKI